MIYHSGNNKDEIDIVENVIDKFNSTVGKKSKNNIIKTCWKEKNSQYREKIDHYEGNIPLYDMGVFIFEGDFDENINREDIEKILKISNNIYVFISENFIESLSASEYRDEFLSSLKSKEENISFKDYRNTEEFQLDFISCISKYIHDSEGFLLENENYKTLNDIYFTLSQDETKSDIYYSKVGDISIGTFTNERIYEEEFVLKNALDSFIYIEQEYMEKIKNSIEKIQNFLLPYVEEKEDDREFKLFRKVALMKNVIDKIEDYTEKNNIGLKKDFFYIADLQESVSVSNFYGVNKLTSDYNADKKYIEIIELYNLIENYNGWSEFIHSFKDTEFLELYIENKSDVYDEDIDIRIEIEKDCIMNLEDIPVPNNWIMTEFLKENEVERLFKIESSKIEEVYLDERNDVFSREESLEILYRKYLMDIFRYEFLIEEDRDILHLKIPYLKYSSKYLFPSRLFFKKQPDKLKYTITSKNIVDSIEKVLKIKKI